MVKQCVLCRLHKHLSVRTLCFTIPQTREGVGRRTRKKKKTLHDRTCSKIRKQSPEKTKQKPPSISLWKCSSHIIFLQSKRLGYRTCTVHFKVIHEHFGQTFKPSICLHKNSLFDALRTGWKVTTHSWTPFCGSISYSSPAPNDITACAGVGDVLALLLNSGRKQRHLYLCQWVVKAEGLQLCCVAGVWVNQSLRSSTRPCHGSA